MEIKIKGIRIHACVPVVLASGGVGTHVLVSTEDLPNIPAAVLDWDATQPLSACPARWKTAGQLRNTFLGHPTSFSTGDTPAIVHACIRGIRIHRVLAVTFPNGQVGTHAQVNTADVAAVIAAHPNLLDWRDDQNRANLPARWKGIIFRGIHEFGPERVEG
jgi:hypothetical protein